MLVSIYMFGVYSSFITGLLIDLMLINKGFYDNKKFNIFSLNTILMIATSWVGMIHNIIKIKDILLDSKKSII